MSSARRITKHLPHYISLLGILAGGVLAFWYFSYDKAFQASVVIAVAASYVTWGIVHHSIHRDLHLSVVIEYFAFALLGAVLVLALIF